MEGMKGLTRCLKPAVSQRPSDRTGVATSRGALKVSAVAAPEAPENAVKQLNKYSSVVTQPKKQGASQAMLYATGLNEEDMNKAQVRTSLPCCL